MSYYQYGQSAETQRLERIQKLITDAEGTLKRLQGDANAAQAIIDHAKHQQEESARAERRRDNMAREAIAIERQVAKAERRRRSMAEAERVIDPSEYEAAHAKAIAGMTAKFYNAGPQRLRAATREAAGFQYLGNKARDQRDELGRCAA